LEKFVIKGGKPLRGQVNISGAKNAAVAILPATILARGKCIIENLPDISDVATCARILQDMGAVVRSINKTTLEIDTTHVKPIPISSEMSRLMRASYYFLGAMLGEYKSAAASMPGGCDLGQRPIDQHLKAFEAIGATTTVEYGMIRAEAEELTEAHIFFDTVSVGATINAMLASVHSNDMVILENVAKEPHIVDVANFLNTMGADVRGAGTDVIKIRGVGKLHGCTYSIIPDQIEAGTYMAAAVITKGNVLVKNVIPKHLEPIIDRLKSAGAQIEEFDDAVRVSCEGPLQPVNVKTTPHPGFPTDMQPQITALLCLAEGTSIVTEGIFDNRFRYVDELARMGANIQVDGRVAVVEGIKELLPAPVRALDLRAGAALVIAALAVNGVSEVEDIHFIERGYANIVEKLQGIGADIRYVDVRESTAQAQ
jgi:UDP-N-acetylglucosamine 1-carboxyvinyltransferase